MKISVKIALIALLMFAMSPAEAAIKCKDGFQYIKGHGWIATPICGERWLSKISGVPVKVLRNDPSERRRVCTGYGADPKVRSICGSDADLYYPRF